MDDPIRTDDLGEAMRNQEYIQWETFDSVCDRLRSAYF